MDQERFDRIARTLGCTGSRRGVVGGLLAGLVGAGIARFTEADAKGQGKKSKGKAKGKKRGKNQGRVGAQALCDANQLAVCQANNACCSTLEGQGCITVGTQNHTGQSGEGGPCGDAGSVCTFCAPGTRCTTDGQGNQVCVCDGSSCPNGCCSNGTGNPGICQRNGSGVCGVGGVACGACPNGCCDVNTGACQQGNEDFACGTGAVLCANCGPGGDCLPSKTCNTCSPATCDGCCDNGVCRPGNANNACGDFGAVCQKCPTGQRCLNSDFGNICGFGGCNQTTCPDGCCEDDVCRLGRSDFACGKGGAVCNICGFDQECKNQTCTNIPCNAQTCPDGCCDQNGLCRFGGDNDSCGVRGSACVACGANENCVNGICTDVPCNASTCPNGCCDTSGTCRNGDTIQACGDGGAACQACTGENPTCVNGTCRANPAPACPTGFEECGGVCVNLGTDKQNCGACGRVCSGCGRRRRSICEGGNCGCTRRRRKKN